MVEEFCILSKTLLVTWWALLLSGFTSDMCEDSATFIAEVPTSLVDLTA